MEQASTCRIGTSGIAGAIVAQDRGQHRQVNVDPHLRNRFGSALVRDKMKSNKAVSA